MKRIYTIDTNAKSEQILTHTARSHSNERSETSEAAVTCRTDRTDRTFLSNGAAATSRTSTCQHRCYCHRCNHTTSHAAPHGRIARIEHIVATARYPSERAMPHPAAPLSDVVRMRASDDGYVSANDALEHIVVE